MHAPSDKAVDRARDHLRERDAELTEVLEGVSAERELAIYLAYRRGLTTPDIAAVIRDDVSTVQRIIGTFLRDEHADSYREGPTWVQLWPNRCWSPGL